MSYLQEFRAQINNRDFAKFWQLWEEYCTSDTVDVEEFKLILQSLKGSDLAKRFGQYVETALPLWKTIKDKEASYDILKLLFDLQTSNSPPCGSCFKDAEGKVSERPALQRPSPPGRLARKR